MQPSPLTDQPFILPGQDYLNLTSPDDPYLVAPLIPLSGVAMLYGEAKLGKSFAALQLAVAIATGTPWLGFRTAHPGPVTYVQLDTPRSMWHQRLRGLKNHGIPVEQLQYADRESLDLWPFDIMNPIHARRLRDALRGLPESPVAVIVDTLKECHQLPENDATEQQKVIAELVRATHPAALIIVHHDRKPSEINKGNIITSSRGSSYLSGRMDAILWFRRRKMHYIGRGIEEGQLHLDRTETGFWTTADDVGAQEAQIADILRRTPSISAAARVLAEQTNRTPEACRSIIRRFVSNRTGS